MDGWMDGWTNKTDSSALYSKTNIQACISLKNLSC
jgi:hypothetical protein